MIVLDNTNRTLQIILAGAKNTNDAPFAVAYEDTPAGPSSISATPGENPGNTNGVTAVTLASAPPAGYLRRVKSININNADLAAITLSIRYNDNGTTYALYKITLQTLEQLSYVDGFGFVAYDANGAEKSQDSTTSSATSTAQSTADKASSQASSIAAAIVPASINSVSSQASSIAAAIVPASINSVSSLASVNTVAIALQSSINSTVSVQSFTSTTWSTASSAVSRLKASFSW